MATFYWAMGLLIAATFVPSAFYFVLYAVTGEKAWVQRARSLLNFTRVLSMFGANLLIWGHVAVGLWRTVSWLT